jgi:hypothetical protein
MTESVPFVGAQASAQDVGVIRVWKGDKAMTPVGVVRVRALGESSVGLGGNRVLLGLYLVGINGSGYPLLDGSSSLRGEGYCLCMKGAMNGISPTL